MSWLNTRKKLTIDRDGDGVIDQFGIVFPTKANFGAVWYYIAFFWQQDGQLFNAEQTAGAFNSEAGVAAAQYWRDLVWKYKALNLSAGWSDFKVGNAAMELSSTSVLGDYRNVMGNANVGLAPLPKGKKRATVSGGWQPRDLQRLQRPEGGMGISQLDEFSLKSTSDGVLQPEHFLRINRLLNHRNIRTSLKPIRKAM